MTVTYWPRHPEFARSRCDRPSLLFLGLSLLAFTMMTGCERPDPEVTETVPTSVPASKVGVTVQPQGEAVSNSQLPTAEVRTPPTPTAAYLETPTPNPTRAGLGGEMASYLTHSVQYGETLSSIARLYGTTVEELMTINKLDDINFLTVDQSILVPSDATLIGPAFKLIPDSELVFGPALKTFDVEATIISYGGYLNNYQEEVEDRLMDGAEIVQLVADRYSVSPRLLLALLEYRGGWVTELDVLDEEYPLDYAESGYDGLYTQLGWAANLVNLGFYGRSEGGITVFAVGEDARVAFASEINDGTAGLQLMFGAFPSTTYEGWLADVGPNGFYATYNRLFGNPFVYTIDPLWPPELSQPPLSLPWTAGEAWYFTGGPHGGWASGSAWAALDFSPQHEELGCFTSNSWVTSMADGVVTRSDAGAVVVDLDGDGFAGTGWAVTYMHLATRDRVPEGALVRAGDRLGHPSCEGGFSTGTHVHVARTYNGRWVSADGNIPFAMGGWVSEGLGREYDGFLVRGDVAKEACGECRDEGNVIAAD